MRAKHLLILTLVAGLATLSAITAASTAPLATASVEPSPDYPKMTMPPPEVKPPVKKDAKSTADHGKFKELQQDFKT
ncbi:MAG: hypothetical protein WBM15_03640, partial [Chromatiaceae bacterium]